jgi:hypothetical protein
VTITTSNGPVRPGGVLAVTRDHLHVPVPGRGQEPGGAAGDPRVDVHADNRAFRSGQLCIQGSGAAAAADLQDPVAGPDLGVLDHLRLQPRGADAADRLAVLAHFGLHHVVH